MKKVSTFILITFLGLCFSCSDGLSGSKAKGRVVDMITGQHLTNVSITAVTKTDIEEDKKFEQQSTKTDANGNFHLKGLSPKYSYILTATKEGYSIAELRFSPPEEGQTKLFEKPFEITKVPLKNGIYTYSNGDLKEVNQIKLKIDIVAINGPFQKNPTKQFFRYLKDPGKEIANMEMEAIIVYLHKMTSLKWGNYYFRKLSFFHELLTCNATSYRTRGEPIWALKEQTNIFIEGAKENTKIRNTIDYYYLWENGLDYKPPSGSVARIGIPTVKGALPSKKIKTHNGYMWIVFIQNLPKGYYTISDRYYSSFMNSKDNGMRWVFGK